MNFGKVIIDFYGGTGAWSEAYRKAGYEVHNITLPEYDVRLWNGYLDMDVHGILAAPPCTKFAISGARWKRTDEEMREALSMVDAVLRAIYVCKKKGTLAWWCLENPVGKLIHYLGKWRMTFQPYEYGDPWTKRTCLWGEFNVPVKCPVKPVGQWTGRADTKGIVDHVKEYLPPDLVHKLPPSPDRAKLRSITPPGFSQAFFKANP